MKKLILILLCLALVAFAGFIAWSWLTPGDPEPVQTPTAAVPEESEPEPVPEPEPEPEPLPPGDPVFFNGTELQTVRQENVDYAPAQAVAEALWLDYTGDADAAQFTGDQVTAAFDAAGTAQWNDQALADCTPISYEGALYLPVEPLAAALDFGVYELDGRRYLTPGANGTPPVEGVNVPVLMYHAVSDDLWGIGELFVSPSSMEEQLKYLVDNGYDPIWFEDLANLDRYDKPVILTFDDGYDDNYTQLYPLLQKYNCKATVFVIANAMGGSHKMTEEQVKELSDSGLVSIQSHGLTHGDMDLMDEATLHTEMDESQQILTRVTGREPYVICYPTGKYTDLTIQVGQQYYQYGLKMVGDLYNTSQDPMQVNRFYVSRYTTIDSFAYMVSMAGT